MRIVLLGGLGGGGDSGGALPLALEAERLGYRPVFVGFVSAGEKEIVGAERVTRALLRVRPDSSSSTVRFFEPALASLGYETYCICLRESKQAVVNALKWLIENYDVRSTIHVDMGGDSLTFGDEPTLGSWEDDMVSLSVLAEISKVNSVKTYLAVGVLGGEGGRGLSPNHLAENLVKLVNDAYHGYYEPEGEVLRKTLNLLPKLLEKAPSAMLTLYLDSLRGLTGMREYHVLYLQGKYSVKQHYKYHFFFDPVKLCKRSYLCQLASREWLRAKPKKRSVRRKPRLSLEEVIRELLKKKVDLRKVLEG